MNSCKTCKVSLEESATIYTDYFQVHGEGAIVYTLCGQCYLKEVKKYLEEVKPLCACGAPEVLYFGDDEEIIDMAIHEGLLNLTCSVIYKGMQEDKYTDEELEELSNHHTIDSMQYIRWYTDEEMGWV
ncbi:hypothetical protein [Metasolibacillus sp. FSL K6-0083]|uniref:hypothetical protein n=1 Tax=Metasolibacillus sp. FSL K6-0083 TaxID=2921416 RepID=UPI00315B1DAD